jgi:hypothetical protein
MLKSTADGCAAGPTNRRIPDAVAGPIPLVLCLALALAAVACDGTLDAGRNQRDGVLSVDHHNPVIIVNDGWSDNWGGEFAVLLANSGGPPLVGIVVGASKYWPNIDENVAGWNDFVTAARAAKLKHVPDVSRGASSPLTVPADKTIESTDLLRSPGAQRIVDLSRQLSLPRQPLVVVTGTQLTDLADAYLIDPTVVDRVVVVASLGQYTGTKATMTGPNGDLDPWADWIVVQRFRYIQVTVLHDQAGDVTAEDIANLPGNRLGDWIAAKQPKITWLTNAADQLAVLAVGLPAFVTAVQPSQPDVSAGFNSPPGQGPPLLPSDAGNATVVTEVAESLVRTQLWRMLQDPRTFGES